MKKSTKIFIGLVCGLLVVSSYLIFRLGVNLKRNDTLKVQNLSLLGERTQLKQQEAEKASQITELKSELAGLRNAQKLKQLLAIAKKRLSKMNLEFEGIEGKKRNLERENSNLNSRLDNLAKEFSKTLNNFKIVKQKLVEAQNDKQIASYRTKIKESNILLKKNEKQLAALNEEIEKLRTENRDSTRGNRALVRKIKILEKKKVRLESKFEKIKKRLNKKQAPVAGLEKKLKELKSELIDKEAQHKQVAQQLNIRNAAIKGLKDKLEIVIQRLSRSEKEKGALSEEIVFLQEAKAIFDDELKAGKLQITGTEKNIFDRQSKSQDLKYLEMDKEKVQLELSETKKELEEQKRIINSLQKEKEDLKANVAYLNEIKSPEGEKVVELQNNLNKAYALYETAKAQVVNFASLLIRKELEMDKSKQRVNELEKELSLLKRESADIGEKLTDARRELGEMDANGYSLKQLKSELKEKDRSLNALQAKADGLNETIEEKEQQIKRYKTKLAKFDAIKDELEEKLDYQERDYEDVNILYGSIKSQIVQVTDLLARRESELESKNKEVLSFRRKMSRLQVDFEITKQELDDVRNRQRRTLDDLTRAAKLNSALQENLIEIYKEVEYSPRNEGKEEADNLMEKVESLLKK